MIEFLKHDQIKAKVAAFRGWVETLTPNQKNLIERYRKIIIAHLHNCGPDAADELISEVLLKERKRRREN